MSEKQRPQLHKYPDQGGHVNDDEYYKPLEERGKPTQQKKEEIENDFEIILEKQNVIDVCNAAINRLLRVAKSGADIHDSANIQNVLSNADIMVESKSTTFEELKAADYELYETVILALLKAKKIK